MDIAKLEKLKVVELKAELQARNLDTKGVKAVLIERLKDAIEKGTPLVGELAFFSLILIAKNLITNSWKKPSRHFYLLSVAALFCTCRGAFGELM